MRLIDADKIITALRAWALQEDPNNFGYDPECNEYTAFDMQGIRHKTIRDALSVVEEQPTIKSEIRWTPFKSRPLTDDEKEVHPNWAGILECELPEDGQRILVTVKHRGSEEVQYDEYYDDGESYLDSGYDISTEAVAWMPLPEPYKGGES